MRMTATHAYVVTSSLYVHNLLNQVREMMTQLWTTPLGFRKQMIRIWTPKAAWWLDTYGFTLQVHSRMSRLSWTSKLFSLSTLSLSSRGISCFFFQWSSTLYVIRTLSYFTLIAERRLGLTMMSIWYAGPVAYYGIYNGKNAHQAVIKNMIQIWGLVGLEK